jgi:hypothetical protein
MFNLTKKEERLLRKMNTPAKIQDYLNKLTPNFEESGETLMSPIQVLREKKCHCFEGALFAAAVIWLNKMGKPLIVDMIGTKDDCDHVIAVFKKNNRWGAISKTNHAVLRYREPIYKDIRELIMSYFHEYTDSIDKGKKTLREFSVPLDLSKFGTEWITSKENLWHIHDFLASIKHFKILTKAQEKNLRRADKIEIQAGSLIEFKKGRTVNQK